MAEFKNFLQRNIPFFERINSNSLSYWITVLFFLILYSSHGLDSQGFDDETWNIYLVEGFKLFDLVNWVQSNDIHPPLSYIYNYLAFQTFSTWPLVRLFNSCFLVFSAVLLSHKLIKAYSFGIGYTFILLFLSNPATLMWGASLRWYSLYISLVNILFAISIHYSRNSISKFKFFTTAVLLVLSLAYTNYITLALAPVLLLTSYYLYAKSLSWKDAWFYLLALIAFYSLFSHQAYIFLANHYPNRGGQIFGFTKSLLAIASAQFSNIGLIPFSFLSSVSAIAMLFLICVAVVSALKMTLQREALFFAAIFVFCEILFLITGLSGKYRNLIVLQAFMYLFVCTTIYGRNILPKILRFLILLPFLTSNLVGIYNVENNNNTMNWAWNIPVAEIISTLNRNSIQYGCEKTIVSSHDSMLDYNLRKNGFLGIFPHPTYESDITGKQAPPSTIGRYQDNFSGETNGSDSGLCFAHIETYSGYASPEKLKIFNDIAFSVNSNDSRTVFIKRINNYGKLFTLVFPNHSDFWYRISFWPKVDNFQSLKELSTFKVSLDGKPPLSFNSLILSDLNLVECIILLLYASSLITLYNLHLIHLKRLKRLRLMDT